MNERKTVFFTVKTACDDTVWNYQYWVPVVIISDQ